MYTFMEHSHDQMMIMMMVVMEMMIADTYTALTMCQALSYIHHMNHLILASQ